MAGGRDDRWTLALDAGMRVHGTDDPASPLLEVFFAGYDRAFVLPDEREDLKGFRDCLALNTPDLPRRAHELCIVAQTAEGALLGGANFLAVDVAVAGCDAAVSVNLNYLFVEAAARGQGLARTLLSAVERLAGRALGREGARVAIFLEQNDPLHLSAADYAADTAHAGIDQIDRLAVWSRLGARLVDFAYVQPALSAGQRADHGLIFAAIGLDGEGVEPRLLARHLDAFFGISVLKGRDPMGDATAAAQLRRLTEMDARGELVRLVALASMLPALRAARAEGRHRSIRALLHSEGAD